MAFMCGSFNNQEEDDFQVLWPFPSTPPRKPTRRHSFCSRSNKDSKNPYSTRGLDKFEALLADLDGKRQKIFTQKGSEDISLVRFVYSNSNDVKPIIVKIRDHRKHDKDHHAKMTTIPKSESPQHQAVAGNGNPSGVGEVQPEKPPRRKRIRVDQLRRKLEEWWKPWYCLPVFVMLILVLLVFFGRSFAILCTSLGWYLVPSINTSTFENPKRPKKITKKEYTRKPSEKMITNAKVHEGMNNQPHRRSF